MVIIFVILIVIINIILIYYSVVGTNLEYMKAGNAMKPLPVMIIILIDE